MNKSLRYFQTMTVSRIQKLREAMKRHEIDAYIVLSSDPHLSEYLPARWCSREWLTGFNGSAATLVLTQDFAGLWTDSRYWEQAEYQLGGTGIELMKAVGGEFLSYSNWLIKNLSADQLVAVDGTVMAITQGNQLEAKLKKNHIRFRADSDLMEEIWDNRPALPVAEIYEHTIDFVSASRSQKLAQLQEKIREHGADWHFMSTLDDIAWLLNLRGADIPFNPVFISYVLIGDEKVTLFTDQDKLSPELQQALLADGIELSAYDIVSGVLNALPDNSSLLLDPRRNTLGMLRAVNKRVKVQEEVNPSTLLKSRKGETEIARTRSAMEQDGAALCEFFSWLDYTLEQDSRDVLTEITISEKLEAFRKLRPGYVSLSFGTIAGFNENGALPHYHATPEKHAVIEGNGFLLIDSGGQYLGGTTDITRVVPVGQLNQKQKQDYTYVLKALIALSSAQFPQSIRASMIDAIARAPLWAQGMDYGHGTGHGVGYFLNVHEGPQSISYHAQAEPQTAMEVGMITSIEPALYRTGQWGIRIENLVVNQKSQTTEFGEYLRFETLTLCPIDTRAVEVSLLSLAEISWLNHYHAMVRERLLPYLSDKAKEWLIIRTEPVPHKLNEG